MKVVTKTGEILGEVVRVLCPPGQTLLEVQGARGSFLIPAVPELVRRIETEAGRIVVELPEGLVDLNAV
jgi:ribosomal 30S subunit maturation factor RimM